MGDDQKKAGGVANKWLVRCMTKLNVLIYRFTGGRLMNRMESGPVCLVTVIGRHSGKRRTIALMYTAHEDKVLLVASLGGAPQHPAWYYNLKANPDIEIQLGQVRRKMRAREAAPEERHELWPKVVECYGSFDAYQRKTSREIPLFVCTPLDR